MLGGGVESGERPNVGETRLVVCVNLFSRVTLKTTAVPGSVRVCVCVVVPFDLLWAPLY